jgi:pre-mRNA-processing factor 19
LTCCQFHPDGHLLGAGGKDGQIKIFSVENGELGSSFETDGPVLSLSFSENGTWLASASQGSTGVLIWDLRKAEKPKEAIIKTIEFGSAISDVAWDYTAQYLAIAGGGAVAIESYQKSGRKWSELFKKAMKSRRAVWDPLGQHLLVDSEKGILELSAASG